MQSQIALEWVLITTGSVERAGTNLDQALTNIKRDDKVWNIHVGYWASIDRAVIDSLV